MTNQPLAATDYSLRILWTVARWIEDKKGRDTLAKIAADAGVSAQDFDGSTRWVSHDQIEKILVSARALADDEDAFRAMLAYRFEESYGAFRYMVWAISQQRMNEAAAKMGKVITNVGHWQILRSERNRFSFRYSSKRPESRLMCISRQVAWSVALG